MLVCVFVTCADPDLQAPAILSLLRDGPLYTREWTDPSEPKHPARVVSAVSAARQKEVTRVREYDP